MNKRKYIPMVAVFLVLSLLVISIGLYLSDALPESITYSINSIKDKLTYDDRELITQTGTEIGGYVSLSRSRMPANIHGAYLDLGTELSPFAQDGSAYNAFVAEAESNFDYLRNFLIDTLFITPDYTGAAGSLTDPNGNQVDILGEYLKYADKCGYFKVLVLNDNCIYQNGQFSFDMVKSYLRNYSFDAVLLSSATLNAQQKLAQAAAFFGKHVKVEFGGACCFGIDVPSSPTARYADADTISALESGFIDFAVVEGNSLKNAALPFSAVMNWWNAKAQVYPDITFYCRHRNDLVMTNTADWNNYIEICDQVRFLWNCENIKGSIFYNVTALKQNVASASVRLSYLIYDGELTDLSVSSIQINNTNNTAVFTGTAAAGYKVLCNGKSISNLPAFTYSAALGAGENDFVFFSAGKSLHYRIYNNTRIIYDYAPQTDISTKSGDTVIISAVCIDGADVRCAVNGKTYQMSAEYSTGGISIPEGYCLYACGIRFSGNSSADQNLGKVVIAATAGENTETVTGAGITVLKSESTGLINKLRELFTSDKQTAANADQNQFSFSQSVSPYRDNGLGTALLCRIVNDDTEMLGTPTEYDTYHADYSTLPEGTIDYIKGMTVTESGFLRYELQSGISVYGVNCELINNGYVLPKNRVFVNKVDDSSPSSTDIIFNIDWFSPVTVKCCPQSYFTGYQSYAFNISAFTAQYVDVTFHYTGDFFNSSLLNFEAASPFSHSELYAEGDENLILRLYLKKTGQFYGFDIYRNEQNQLVLSFKKHADGSLQGKTVMLDAGHGGLSMTGTALSDNSIAEKTVTLAIAYKTKQMLEAKGARVLMTRTMDTAISLEERTAMQSAANPDIFVSIHCDGTDNIADAGTHTFYFRPYSQPLASEINTSLTSVYQTYIYVPTDTNYAKVDKSIKYYPFFVTRMNHCPSVLVETGFMTNPVEGQILASDNAQYWIAKGISDGIEAYFANNHA